MQTMKPTTFLALCALPFLLVTCATIPITGKLCYNHDGNIVCVGSDGRAINLEGHLTNDQKSEARRLIGDGKAVVK